MEPPVVKLIPESNKMEKCALLIKWNVMSPFMKDGREQGYKLRIRQEMKRKTENLMNYDYHNNFNILSNQQHFRNVSL